MNVPSQGIPLHSFYRQMMAKEMQSNEKEQNTSGRSLIFDYSQRDPSEIGGALGNIVHSTLKKEPSKNQMQDESKLESGSDEKVNDFT